MILKMNNLDKNFYLKMGEFFATRKYIKEMDCQFYDNSFQWYIYKADNKILGFASIEEKEKYNYLDNFFVLPEYRNLKIGTKIIEEIINDYKKIKLISRNKNAIKIFEKIGFIKTGQSGRYFKMELNNE